MMNFDKELEGLRKKAKTKEQKYAVEQAAKNVSFRLRMESPFKKELKTYFGRQSSRIKRGLSIQSIEQELDRQYERVATGYKRNIKQGEDELDDRVDVLIAGSAADRAVGIDKTTTEKYDRAVEEAKKQLAEEGNSNPTDREVRIVAGNIFKTSNYGRIGTIALMETAFIDDAINNEARALSVELYETAAITGNTSLAEEANRISPSLTGDEIVRDISIGASPASIMKKLKDRYKMWITMMDTKVRSFPFDHQTALFQKKKIDEPFIVSNERLMRPRDTSYGASAGNVINCRCHAQDL